jgi:hypothetical protein
VRAAPVARRFPPPWTVENIGARFVVKDSSGQKLGYFYYEEEPGRLLTKDEARRIAATWRSCPGLFTKQGAAPLRAALARKSQNVLVVTERGAIQTEN